MHDVDVFCLAIYKMLIVLLLLYGAFILWRNVCFTRAISCRDSVQPSTVGPIAGGDQRTGTRHSFSYLITNADRVSSGARTIDVGLAEQIYDHRITDVHVDLYVEEVVAATTSTFRIKSEDGRRREISLDSGEGRVATYVCYAVANKCRTEYNMLDLLDKLTLTAAACAAARSSLLPLTVWLCDVETAERNQRSRVWWVESLAAAFNRYVGSMRGDKMVRVSAVRDRRAFVAHATYGGVDWRDRV